MGILIWPTEGDIADQTNQGLSFYEPIFQDTLNYCGGFHNGVVEGFTPTNPSGLTVRLSSGFAIINGYRVWRDSTLDITAIDNRQSYQYLALSRDENDCVTGVSGVSYTTLKRDPDLLLISRTIATGEEIILLTHEVEYSSSILSGAYTGDGTSDRTISINPTALDVIPIFVSISTADTSTYQNLLSFSAIEAPGNRRYYNDYNPNSRFYFSDGDATFTRTTTLYESVAWSFSISSSNQYRTKAVSVANAGLGDFVRAFHTDYQSGSTDGTQRELKLQGHVTATGTVTVWATTYGDAVSHTYDGYLEVLVIKQKSINLGGYGFLEGNTSKSRSPQLTMNGFIVSYDGDEGSLNTSGNDYNYIAIT